MFTHNLRFKEEDFPGIQLGSEALMIDATVFDLPTVDRVANVDQAGDTVGDIGGGSTSQSEGFHDTTSVMEDTPHSDDSQVELLLHPSQNQNEGVQPSSKKGYANIPYYGVAPRDITSSLSEDNIILTQHPANNIVMEPSVSDPLSYKAAVSSSSALDWVAAIDNELQNMEHHVVWLIRKLIPGFKPLSCKWVFKTKFNMFGKIDKFKARLVVRGFLQKEGIDYTATFSPTGRLQTLRIILAIAALLDLE